MVLAPLFHPAYSQSNLFKETSGRSQHRNSQHFRNISTARVNNQKKWSSFSHGRRATRASICMIWLKDSCHKFSFCQLLQVFSTSCFQVAYCMRTFKFQQEGKSKYALPLCFYFLLSLPREYWQAVWDFTRGWNDDRVKESSIFHMGTLSVGQGSCLI